jgi:hypothetical protein
MRGWEGIRRDGNEAEKITKTRRRRSETKLLGCEPSFHALSGVFVAHLTGTRVKGWRCRGTAVAGGQGGARTRELMWCARHGGTGGYK